MPQNLLEPHMWSLENLFKNIFNIPVYQRPYSWNTENVKTLLKDIIDCYNSNDKDEGYYTGNIILYDNNIKKEQIAVYDVVDGQQRITTFSLMLLALYSLALKRGVQADDDTIKDLQTKYLWKKGNDRNLRKDLKILSLNSIEKECFNNIFNQAFKEPKELYNYVKEYEPKNEYDSRIKENFKEIYDYFNVNFEDNKKLMQFTDYILCNIKFICIECRNKVNKAFSIFEAINSKGKKLEEIDLFKTYIFSALDETSYDEYLEKWGELIIETKDELYDYIYTYVRSMVTYYRQNIKIVNFKSLSNSLLKDYFKSSNLCDTFKRFIDDLLKKVKYYNMLSSLDDACNLIKSSKFRFYYSMLVDGPYKHHKPLFFRTFIDYAENKIGKVDAITVIVEITKFMIEYFTLCKKDSKPVTTMFSYIMDDIYVEGINVEKVKARIVAQINKGNKGFTSAMIENSLKELDGYEENKTLAIALLSLYDTYVANSNKITYDSANLIIKDYSLAFSLDHLLAKDPQKNNDKYFYYKDVENGNEIIVLKNGHDFPKLPDNSYDTFRKRVLNKLGNLRICVRDINSQRKASAITLPNYGEFTTYKDITNREEKLVKFLMENVFNFPKADFSIIERKAKDIEQKLPNMEQLIDYGELMIGDEIYLTNHPNTSQATLIEPNKVEYQGTVMTLNEWGTKLTGWTSIRIYAYVAKVGETETLQQKRIRIMEEKSD